MQTERGSEGCGEGIEGREENGIREEHFIWGGGGVQAHNFCRKFPGFFGASC